MKSHSFRVHAANNGMRIDLFLASSLPELSRRKIRAILDVGGVYVNRHRMRVASRTVKTGDEIKVEYNLESLKKLKSSAPALKPEDIVYNDENLIAINKPPGLPSQATRDQAVVHAEIALKKLLQAEGDKPTQLVLLHRLDKETSGILLFARNSNATEYVGGLFRNRQVSKTYLALVIGQPANTEFFVQNFLSEIDKKSGLVSAVRSGGKSAKTSFKLLATDAQSNVSLVACFPETGRSHQIRVHLADLGHTIVGDKRYGSQRSTRLAANLKALTTDHHFLHAARLEFSMPKGKISVNAALPKNFAQVLEQLGWQDIFIPAGHKS